MMFRQTLSLILAMVAGSASAGSLRANEGDLSLLSQVSKEHVTLFRQWTEQYNKVYSSETTLMDRLKVWLHNHGT